VFPKNPKWNHSSKVDDKWNHSSKVDDPKMPRSSGDRVASGDSTAAMAGRSVGIGGLKWLFMFLFMFCYIGAFFCCLFAFHCFSSFFLNCHVGTSFGMFYRFLDENIFGYRAQTSFGSYHSKHAYRSQDAGMLPFTPDHDQKPRGSAVPALSFSHR